MSNDSKRTTLIFAIAIGAISGAIAGGVISLFFLNQPRSIEDSRIAVEAFSPAGLVGAIAASVITEAGWTGAFITGAIGWVLGLALPAVLISLFINDKE